MELLKELTKSQFHGIIIFLIGVVLVWFVLKRRHNRRGPAGLQHYSNKSGLGFEVGCLTTISESILILLGFAGLVLGGLMVVIDW